MNSPKECSGRLFDKHRFKPRFREVENEKYIKVDVIIMANLSASEIRSLNVHQEYVYDICTKCGKIVGQIEYKIENMEVNNVHQ